jgi:hypothetical protein
MLHLLETMPNSPIQAAHVWFIFVLGKRKRLVQRVEEAACQAGPITSACNRRDQRGREK